MFTRRDSDLLPERAEWVKGVHLIYVPAGPPTYVRKERLLPYMADFTAYVHAFCKLQHRQYDLIHANFWMSALIAAEMKEELGIPFVVTFHALGRVRRLQLETGDESPDERFNIEDRACSRRGGSHHRRVPAGRRGPDPPLQRGPRQNNDHPMWIRSAGAVADQQAFGPGSASASLQRSTWSSMWAAWSAGKGSTQSSGPLPVRSLISTFQRA